MAIQPPHKKQPGAQILRTPAPKQDLKTGGESYGQANAVEFCRRTAAGRRRPANDPRKKFGIAWTIRSLARF